MQPFDLDAFQRDGYALIRAALTPTQVAALIASLPAGFTAKQHYGVRDLMRQAPQVRALAESSPYIDIVRRLLGDAARPVRSVFFDKIPQANWSVPWHQDTSIAVATRADLPGFGVWSEKQGVPHVEPPLPYLEGMVTLRLHLDGADRDNGALRVVPGSHRHGRIAAADLLAMVEREAVAECEVAAGDLLVMRPLLLHASRKSQRPEHRRVIHLEYSAMQLPVPLRWHEA